MDTLFAGWVLGYLAVIAVSFLLLFVVVRAAILSALAKDRERVRLDEWRFEQDVQREERKLEVAAKKRADSD